jgi:hypothetical protein
MDSQITARRRRSVRVDLVYSNQPGAATRAALRPRRSWRAFLAELVGVGRFGGFGRIGRLHHIAVGS